MKLKNIQLLVLPLMMALLMTCQLRADVNINWTADSIYAVDVIISGSGLADTSNPWALPDNPTITAGFSTLGITSPSGLWQLTSVNYIALDQNPVDNQPAIDMFGHGYLSLLNDPYGFNGYSTPPSFNENLLPAIAPTEVGDGLTFTLGPNFQSIPTGIASMTLTSLPDLNDPSTWTWSFEYSISGLTYVVPEPGAVNLALLGAGILALRKLTDAHRKNRTPTIV